MLEERYPQLIKEARELKIQVLSHSKAERKFLKTFRHLMRQLEGSLNHRSQRNDLWFTQMQITEA